MIYVLGSLETMSRRVNQPCQVYHSTGCGFPLSLHIPTSSEVKLSAELDRILDPVCRVSFRHFQYAIQQKGRVVRSSE
jgi:hypothetical protein